MNVAPCYDDDVNDISPLGDRIVVVAFFIHPSLFAALSMNESFFLHSLVSDTDPDEQA